jgi:uncharacterized membrane protein
MLKKISLWILSVFFILAGVRHFTHRQFYLSIVPPYIPWHLACVYVSGVAESALGLALLVPRLSRLAAWGLIALLIAVFPANIYMWTAHVPVGGVAIPGWFHAVRLPLQAVLIAWAYWHTRPSPPRAAPSTIAKSA